MADQTVPELEFSGLANQGRKFINPHLRAGVTTYPLRDDHPFAHRGGSGTQKFDWGPDAEATVTSLSWDKSMGQASGRWTAVLKPKLGEDRFQELDVLDGDWADVSIMRNGVVIPLCRGVVDSVRERRISVGGATSVVVTITGRDHGAFFEYPITWNSVWARGLATFMAGFATDRMKWKTGGSPDVLFRALINGWFQGGKSGAGQWEAPLSFTDRFPPKRELPPAFLPSELRAFHAFQNLAEILKVVTFNSQARSKSPLRGELFNEELWTVGEQNLHQTLSQWVNPLLNEWWYDLLMPQEFTPKNGLNAFLSTSDPFLFQSRTGVGQAVVESTEDFGTIAALIRERPFMTRGGGLNSMWSSLPTWRIPTWLVIDSDLGIGGHERYNVFDVMADVGIAPSQEQAAHNKPIWSRSDIRQRGLRSYSETTRYITADGEGGWQKERSTWAQILQDWWGPNPYLRQGTIQIGTLLPEIRIGQRILLDPGDPLQVEQFYVEGVSLAFRGPDPGSGAGGTTTLYVTRGFRGDDQQLLKSVTALANHYEESF